MRKQFTKNAVKLVCSALIMSMSITSCNAAKQDLNALVPTEVVSNDKEVASTDIVNEKDDAEKLNTSDSNLSESDTTDTDLETEGNKQDDTQDGSDAEDGNQGEESEKNEEPDNISETEGNNGSDSDDGNKSDETQNAPDESDSTKTEDLNVEDSKTEDSKIEEGKTDTEIADNKEDDNGTADTDKSDTDKSDSDKVGSDKTDSDKETTVKDDKNTVDENKKDTKKDSDKTENNRYKSEELQDYISVSVLDMTDEEFAAIAPTVNMSFEELIGDNGIYNGYPKAFPKPDTYKIVVDLRYCIVMVFTKDDDGNYTVPHRFMICSPGASTSNTPTGTFGMKDYKVRFSLFNNTASYGQYWSLINGRIYFHSVLYSSMSASDYTESSYKNLGHGASHGCIRLTVPDARWIWYNIGPDTTCIIRYGDKNDKEMQAIKDRLVLAKLPSKRVKIEKGKIPNTDNWSIDDVPQEVPYVNGHQ